MHFGLRLIVSLVISFGLFSVSSAQPGGFEDFDDEIILKDKESDTSDLDFMENGKKSETPKKKQEVEDEDVLTNLEKEVEKSKDKEKKDEKKAETAPQKRTVKEKEEKTPETTQQQDADELLLMEEEQEQAEIEEGEKPKATMEQAPTDDLNGIGEDQDLKAIEDQESEMDSADAAEEKPTQPTMEEAPEEILEQTPAQRPSRKWAKPMIPTAPTEEEEDSEPLRVGEVEIEKYPYQKAVKKCNCRYDALVPYTIRRETWTNTFSLGSNTYQPVNFEPDAFADDLENVYGSAEMPLLEVSFGLKYNFSLGSLALDLGGGYYTNTSSTYDSKLNLIFANTALTLYLDNLFSEPYVVPYGTGGLSYVFYSETVASNEAGGGTTTLFLGGGLLFQLDWMDEQANIDSYEDFGLENTYLYIEGRIYPDLKILASEGSPDLSSSNIALLAGLKFEF